ncbi:MAG: lysophospholipid acyltransferase family protein [Bacteroidales bacterium]|nr:lysophospholipid acyltransferase family protein [Bacteroidales bacterium]
MIKADHRWFFVWFIKLYTAVNLKLYFRKVVIDGDLDLPSELPVLLVGNHFSWWDGFFAYYLNEKVFRRKFHVMMLEEQLLPRMFLNKAGAYSIKKASRTVIESINYSSELLSARGNLVVIYPQGEIESQYNFPVRFERGIERIIRNARGDFSIVFYTAFVDWFSSKRPVLTFRLSRYEGNDRPSHDELEAAFNRHMYESMSKQIPEK